MNGFITYWSREYITELERNGDTGPISVIFGSHHIRMPSIAKVKKGDIIYPVTVYEGNFYAMARLPVENIECAFEYLIRVTGNYHRSIIPDNTAIIYGKGTEDEFAWLSDARLIKKGQAMPSEITRVIEERETDLPHKFHQQPQTCCAALAACGEGGSDIGRVLIPREYIPLMRFGARGKEKPLKTDKNGVPSIVSLSGFVRRMDGETFKIFEKLFQ